MDVQRSGKGSARSPPAEAVACVPCAMHPLDDRLAATPGVTASLDDELGPASNVLGRTVMNTVLACPPEVIVRVPAPARRRAAALAALAAELETSATASAAGPTIPAVAAHCGQVSADSLIWPRC